MATSNKKEAILQAAMHLLLREGEQSASMSRIGKEAKTGMGTIYNYFPSKEVLINALFTKLYQKEEAYVQDALKKEQAPAVKKRFMAFWFGRLHFARENPDEHAFLSIYRQSPIISEETLQNCNGLNILVGSMMEEGQVQGIIKEIDLKTLRKFTENALTSFTKLPENELEYLVTMAWDAIKS